MMLPFPTFRHLVDYSGRQQHYYAPKQLQKRGSKHRKCVNKHDDHKEPSGQDSVGIITVVEGAILTSQVFGVW